MQDRDARRRAVGASPEDGEVRAIHREITLGQQTSRERVDEVRGHVHHSPAEMTDHVDVLIVGGPERRRAMTQVGVAHEAEVLEQLQRAIHGGDVDVRHGIADLLGGRMAQRANRVEDLLALVGHAQAARPQPLGQLVMTAHPSMLCT